MGDRVIRASTSQLVLGLHRRRTSAFAGEGPHSGLLGEAVSLEVHSHKGFSRMQIASQKTFL